MSEKHPIVAVTGSSGAGTSSVTTAFEHIFQRQRLSAAWIEGESLHRHDRARMAREVELAAQAGRTLTHFGPDGNLFDELVELFRGYGDTGTGRRRRYLHTPEDALEHGGEPGTFTAWEALPEHSDLLFYEGLHGGLVTADHNVAHHVDLLIGVVPIINLEWIQKIHRDRAVRGYSAETATQMILRRMPDYVHYICPQFSRTDINFQRIPTIDTHQRRKHGGDPDCQSAEVKTRFPRPAGDAAGLVYVAAGYAGGAGGQERLRDGVAVSAGDRASDRAPQPDPRRVLIQHAAQL